MSPNRPHTVAELRERNRRTRLAQVLNITVDAVLDATAVTNATRRRNETLENSEALTREYFDIYDASADAYLTDDQQAACYHQAFSTLAAQCEKLFDAHEIVQVLFHWEGKPMGVRIPAALFNTNLAVFDTTMTTITIATDNYDTVIELYPMEYALELVFSDVEKFKSDKRDA